MKIKNLIPIIIILGCSNFEEFDIRKLDLKPPMILELKMVSNDTITIRSNEDITLDLDSSYIEGELNISESSISSMNISITLDRNSEAGREYIGYFRIVDLSGNSLSVVSRFYGYNESLAGIIINEFIVKGSTTNPNKVELYVNKPGSLAGVTLFNGTKNNFDYYYTFPDIKVNEGEFIVVRTCSDNYSIPYVEIDSIDIDHDKKFIEGVRDIRIDNFKLSSTNGVITLYDNPFGDVMDCVIYSKNQNDSEKRYRNFGLSKTLSRVDEMVNTNNWIIDSDLAQPEDVIYIGDSTSTRSINRYRLEDSNNRSNWYVVDTGEATFGYENSEILY